MTAEKPEAPETVKAPQGAEKSQTVQKPHSFGVAFFDTQQAALANLERLKTDAARFDRFNIVIREEVKNLDPALDSSGHVYCGPVWWQVHEQRMVEGFYKEQTHGTL